MIWTEPHPATALGAATVLLEHGVNLDSRH